MRQRSMFRVTAKAVTCVLAAVTLAGATVGIASPAAVAEPGSDKPVVGNDDPSAGSNVAAEIMAWQAPLVNVADAITRLDPERTGLGGIQLQVEKHAVQVWWKGNPPDSLAALIKSAQRDGITVIAGRAKYSEAELAAAQAQLVADLKRYPAVVSAGPQPDGSGLQIGVTDLEAAATYVFPVAVTLVTAVPITQTSRANDTWPFWGGAVTLSPVGVCTTGFAVATHEFGGETSRGLLTAEHCAPGGGVRFRTGTGAFLGNAFPAPRGNSAPHSDSLYIRTDSGTHIYDGGVGVGEFAKGVAGWVNNFPGEHVCTSGAVGGARCNFVVDRVMTMGIGGTGVVMGVDFGHTTDCSTASFPGDSGGPVFTLASPGMVNAAGMIEGTIFDGMHCPGNPAAGLAFIDLSYIMVAQGVSVLTT